jgi:hypothetical protein
VSAGDKNHNHAHISGFLYRLHSFLRKCVDNNRPPIYTNRLVCRDKVSALIGERSSLKFWARWTVANGIGELVGLGTVFVVGYFVIGSIGEPDSIPALAGLALLVIVLAAFEGTMVGLAQWLVLRQSCPGISFSAWGGATATGAVIAWILGMIPSTIGAFGDATPTPADEPSLPVILGLAAIMGAILGVVLAVAQWWVLRRHVRHASVWLAANATAWLVAMPLIFLLVGSTIAEHHTLGSLALLALGIGGAGLVVGSIHGIFLIRLLSRGERQLNRRSVKTSANK